MWMHLSPEGLFGKLDDVSSGLNINVVIVQGGWVCGRSSLSQQNPQPATHLLRGGGLKAKVRVTEYAIPPVSVKS